MTAHYARARGGGCELREGPAQLPVRTQRGLGHHALQVQLAALLE